MEPPDQPSPLSYLPRPPMAVPEPASPPWGPAKPARPGAQSPPADALRPLSSSFGSTTTLAERPARYSPYPPSSCSTLASGAASARTPSGPLAAARRHAGHDYFAPRPRSASRGKAASAPAVDDESPDADSPALPAPHAGSRSLPLTRRRPDLAGEQPAAPAKVNLLQALFPPPAAAAPEHYPLEPLALLFTLGIHAAWNSVPLPALRAAILSLPDPLRPPEVSAGKLFRFYQWSHQLLSRTRLPAFSVLSALVYVHRLCSSPTHAASAGLPVDPGSEYRVASTAAILSNKYLDDNRFTNRTWGTVTGFSVAELTRMEVEFGHSISWDLAVNEGQWSAFIADRIVGAGLWRLAVDVLGARVPGMQDGVECATRVLTVMTRKLPQDDAPALPAARPKASPAPAGAPGSDLISALANRRLPSATDRRSSEALQALAAVQAHHRQASLVQAAASACKPERAGSAAFSDVSSATLGGRSAASMPLPGHTHRGRPAAADPCADGRLAELVEQIQRAARLEPLDPRAAVPAHGLVRVRRDDAGMVGMVPS